jgi:hypothetical protein
MQHSANPGPGAAVRSCVLTREVQPENARQSAVAIEQEA